MCAAGYTGVAVIANNGMTGGTVTGCSPCAGGTWSSAGSSQTCIPISPCIQTGYTAAASACLCAVGFYGVATLASGTLQGCTLCPAGTYGATTVGKISKIVISFETN